MSALKGSERQKMLINYVKEGIVPEGFYVKHTKNGTIQFRRIKKKDTQSMIEKYEKKLEELKEKLREEQLTDDASRPEDVTHSKPQGHDVFEQQDDRDATYIEKEELRPET